MSGDAVEYSKKSLVDQLMPLVEGHRYAAYIRSFSASPFESQRLAEILYDITVVDPRARMQPLFNRIWHASTAGGKDGNELAWRSIWARDFTLSGLLDMYYGLALTWTSSVLPEHRQIFAQDFREISPYSPNAVRLQWETKKGLSSQELSELESELKDDPVGWMTIGNYYYSLNDLDASERCFARSLDISPCYDSTVGLANTYFYKGKRDLWQATLESYLEIDDLGLAHAQIHQQIAEQHIRDRAWSKAAPHAFAAAETYSASGLLLAGTVCEGLHDWDKSEHFVAEATRSYPSYWSGTSWYFWCRRNGRGDLEAARDIAARNIEHAATQTRYDDAYRTFLYRILEGNQAEALAGLDQQIATCLDGEPAWDTSWRLLHIIALSAEMDDTARLKQAIDELKTHVDQTIKATHPNWVEIYDGLCQAFSGDPLPKSFFKTFDEAMTSSCAEYRCSYWYFLGAALDQLGDKEKAELYWRRAAFGGPFDTYNATLAGHRLVERFGADRGGIPEDIAQLDSEASNDNESSEKPASPKTANSQSAGEVDRSDDDGYKAEESSL